MRVRGGNIEPEGPEEGFRVLHPSGGPRRILVLAWA